jgi:streptogramin lyase
MRPLVRTLLAAALSCAALVSATPARAATSLEDGDVLTIATPNVSPPVDYVTLVRIKPTTGVLDSIVHLPSGNAPVAITVAPWNGMVYVLGKTSVYRVDPCTGAIATVTSGGLLGTLPPIAKILAHSNGSLYVTRGTITNGVIRIDPLTGAQSLLANPYSTFSASPMGLTEGADHQLYVSTVGTSATPSMIRIDPVTGAMNFVASGLGNGTVRDPAFDTRDSLFVIRISAPTSFHRVDRVTGTIGQLTTTSITTNVYGNMAAHPDGGLYFPGSPTTGINAMYRLDPVSKVVSAVTTPQSTVGFFTIAVMRGFVGCPTPTNTTTWGRLKVQYR